MNLGLINSAFAQAGKGTEFGLEQTKRIGFDTVDIFADPLDIDIRERRLVKETCDRLALPIKSIACVAVGLIDPNPAVQRFHVSRCKAYLDLCYEYDRAKLLLVLGEYIWQQEVVPPAEQWKIAVERVTELGRYARELGVQIVIELEPFKLSLVNTVDTMLRLLNEVAMPETVRANCDISHLYLMGIKPAEITHLADLLGHVHLSDCNGKTHGDLPPGRGVVPIIDYLRVIRDAGFNETVSIELEYAPQPDQIVEWVREAYEKTNAIMRELACRGKVC